MDVITHLALGICTTEVVLHKAPDKKILFWGAVAQALPDIDTIPALFLPAHQALLIHRGFTHSLVFAIGCGFILALIVKKGFKTPAIPLLSLFLFFWFQLTLHDLLDVCNSYGTGLLEPFSHQRFSINLLYVADPVFTIGLIVAGLLLIFKSRLNLNRNKCAWTALTVSALYLVFAGFNKNYIDNKVNTSLSNQKINPAGYFSTPAPFTCMLWYIVVAADSTYYTAYSSVWDDTNQPIIFESHIKNYRLADSVRDRSALQDLIIFTDHYYTISQSGHSLYLNVLRFGQVQGWSAPDAPFVLSYPLTAGNGDAALLQKGRLAGWNVESLKTYIK
ncbi:MAG TPA: metal-dependent hydrolase, partial [Mucilaginibacter sp.]|nr:metal-dependent hydrolase [Mucilaginibacter sp.]